MSVGEQDCVGLEEITIPVYLIKKKKRARKAIARKKKTARKAAK